MAVEYNIDCVPGQNMIALWKYVYCSLTTHVAIHRLPNVDTR